MGVERFFGKEGNRTSGRWRRLNCCILVFRVNEKFMQSLPASLLLFWWQIRRAYKSFLDLRFHPLIIEFFWFALARHCSASRKTHTNVVVVSRGFRGRGWGFISSAWCACVCVCACVRVCVCVCLCGGWGGGGVRWLNYLYKPHFGFAKYLICASPWLGGGKENL